jgi:carboxyl-terminal processing protease
MRPTFITIIGFGLALSRAGAQTPGRDAATIALADRLVVASRVYAVTISHFALWDRVPQLDPDSCYRQYVEQAIASDRREDFDRATFVARLHSGHTWFDDGWLELRDGQPIGFDARLLDGRWVIVHSQVSGLEPGDVVITIDGQPMSRFFEASRSFIPASNDREARDGLFQAPYLFPERFRVGLADGRDIPVDRTRNPEAPKPQAESRWLTPNRIAYIRLPSFADMAVGVWARAQLDRFQHADAIIIDLRGNQGGMSWPMEETRARLLGRTYDRWIERMPAHIGRLDTDVARDPALTYRLVPPLPAVPDSLLYVGRVVVLVDGECASACEDFAMPFKGHARATVVGDTTAGTFSQTVRVTIGEMTISMASTEVYFANGAPFEGIGVAPDIVVSPTVDDIRAGRDLVLAHAMQVAIMAR